jgi:hypothetical protein
MIPILTAAANSADNLAQVQAGFTSSPDIGFADVKVIVYILLALILIGAVAAVIERRRRAARRKKMGWSSISNPQHIWEILTTAIYRQASVNIELYQANHSTIYKGTLSSLENEAYLIVTLAESPSVDMQFKDLLGVLHLNFRPSLKEPLEHYQFSTKIEDSRNVKIRSDWREWQLIFPIPKVITSAQRRSFLRLEPASPFEVYCTLYEVPEDSFPDISGLTEVVSGKIMDLSIGGAQILVPSIITLKETQRFVGILKLPTENLDTTITNPNQVLLIQLMSQDFLAPGDDVENKARNILRLRFLGQYLQESLNKTWVYRSLGQLAMEDLSHWLQAYQRYQIKKRHNLLPMDSSLKPPNMFPSSPPKRPPLRED